MPRLAFRRKKKIHVVSNENSGKSMGRKQERETIIEMLEHAWPNARHSPAALTVHRTHSLNDLDAAKDEMRVELPDIIFIFSGDGGIHKLLGEEDGFLDALQDGDDGPLLVFIRMGSTNTISGALNLLGRDQVMATKRIIRKIERGDPLDVIHRHYLNINGKRGFIYGSGLAANLLEKYNAKSPKGVRRVMKVGAWMLFNELFRFLPPWRRTSVARKVPVAYEYRSDGAPVVQGVASTSGVVASSLEQVGMGCRLTQRVVNEDRGVDHFQCTISQMGFWRTVATLPSWYQGILPGSMIEGLATRVVLEYGKPVLHTIDGELYGPEEMTDKVVIERGPLLNIVLS